MTKIHDETLATALGEIETPMQKLQRERDEAREAAKAAFEAADAMLRRDEIDEASVDFIAETLRAVVERADR